MGKKHKSSPALDELPVKQSKRNEAAKLILSLLRDGAMESSKVLKILKDKGISERTAKAAKDDVGAGSFREGTVWFWCLNNEQEGEKNGGHD